MNTVFEKIVSAVAQPAERERLPIRTASLFAGVGGIELAFRNAGFLVTWSNEIDPVACKTMRMNFGHKIIEGDIKSLTPEEAEIVVAGFPCQAFSVAGYRKGLADHRGAVFFDMIEVIRRVKPRAVFLENVKNLLRHNKGATFSIVEEELEKSGYGIKYKVMNTHEYSSLPQNRERLYIVGFKNKKSLRNFSFPPKVEYTELMENILESEVDNSYYYDDMKHYPVLKKEIKRKDTFYQWRRQYVRENKSNLCPTLTANMGTGGHNVPLILDDKGIRKLTPRECFRIQGFPEDFMLPSIAQSKLYKQAGNSVSVPVIENMAKNMYNILRAEMDNKRHRT